MREKESLTRNEVEEHLSAIERRILEETWSTAIWWFGFHFRWQRGRKRDGDTLRRKGIYGRIIYTEHDEAEGLSRDELIERALIPFAFRQMSADLKAMIFCSICASVGIGFEEKRHWVRFHYNVSAEGRSMLTLCPKCVQELVARRRLP